ncbi:MAG: hypothetical protein IKI97_03120 [Clostridia bacterium]|nr:hypothetical protein [Clostridia bacterium]
MLMYCEKCAYIGKEKNPKKALCPACETTLLPIPDEYLTPNGFMFVNPESKKKFESEIRQRTNYNANAGNSRDEIIQEKERKRSEEVQAMVDEYKNNSFRASCPICKSHKIDKISNIGKVVKVGVFGILGAGDLGKTYKCTACGYKF